MAIYVKQSSKVGGINHQSKATAKGYAENMLVFQHMLTGGPLYDIENPLILNPFPSSEVNPKGNILDLGVSYLEAKSLNLKFPISKCKNGIKVTFSSSLYWYHDAHDDIDSGAVSWRKDGYLTFRQPLNILQISKDTLTGQTNYVDAVTPYGQDESFMMKAEVNGNVITFTSFENGSLTDGCITYISTSRFHANKGGPAIVSITAY